MAGALGTAIFVTYLVPPTVLFVPLANIIRSFRLGDTPWALILTYPTFLIPFCTWLLMGYFKTIPRELEECARIDGATRFGAMLRIIFPIATPGSSRRDLRFTPPERIPCPHLLSSPAKTVPIGRLRGSAATHTSGDSSWRGRWARSPWRSRTRFFPVIRGRADCRSGSRCRLDAAADSGEPR
jgi:hypothetical protein